MKRIVNIIIVCLSVISLMAQTIENSESEIVKDIDGNIYHTVKIGNQVWLKENLRTTSYTNGDKIETTTPHNLNISGNSENIVISPESVIRDEKDTPKYQWAYNGDDSLATIYGRLYTWDATNDARGICPQGWHIPNANEWSILTKHLGNDVVAGGKLKDVDLKLWNEPNTGATNESGFTALPAGGRNNDGTFSGLGYYAAWWTTAPYSNRHIEYDDLYTYRNYYYITKHSGFSVRCIKD
jgi:uncharacterized protein (TIGR02145 family)